MSLIADAGLRDAIVALADDAVVRHYDGEAVAWSPRGEPLHLDPASAVIVQLLDGSATVGQLAREISEEVGIPEPLAFSRLRDAVTTFEHAGLLDDSNHSALGAAEPSWFHGPLNP